MFPRAQEAKCSSEERPDDLKGSSRGISNGVKEYVDDHSLPEEIIPVGLRNALARRVKEKNVGFHSFPQLTFWGMAR